MFVCFFSAFLVICTIVKPSVMYIVYMSMKKIMKIKSYGLRDVVELKNSFRGKHSSLYIFSPVERSSYIIYGIADRNCAAANNY